MNAAQPTAELLARAAALLAPQDPRPSPIGSNTGRGPRSSGRSGRVLKGGLPAKESPAQPWDRGTERDDDCEPGSDRVCLDAGPTGVAARGGHRGVLPVFHGGPVDATSRDDLHVHTSLGRRTPDSECPVVYARHSRRSIVRVEDQVVTTRRTLYLLAAMVILFAVGVTVGLIWADTSDVAGAFAGVTNVVSAAAIVLLLITLVVQRRHRRR
jgi:hypothetical protein